MSNQLPWLARVQHSKAAAACSNDRISRWYDFIAGSSEKKFWLRGLAMLNPQPGEHILEIGCGTGGTLCQMVDGIGKNGTLIRLDLSAGMLTVSRSRIKKQSLTKQIQLVQADGAQIPFQAGFFDAIFMRFTLELFDRPDLPEVMHACYRLLRGDGRIVVVALAEAINPNLALRIYHRAHRRFPAVVDCRPIFVDPLLSTAGFWIKQKENRSKWGLPVSIVLAVK